MNNRDMYYNSYGYGGYMPIQEQPNMFPQQIGIPQNSYSKGQLNDMTERINRLERQVKRLDQRLTRLETPYANNIINNEPDNNMYIM